MNAKTVLGLILGFCITLGQAGAQEVSLDMFTPQGEVKGVHQVTARFTEQMVPFGEPRLTEPFDITCPEKGRGRWVDGRNWVYDFERDLPAGVACEFTVRSDLKTLAGKKIGGRQRFTFTTGGPAVKRANPYEGSQIDEDQAFVLALDAEAKEESVLQNVYCSVEGIAEKIGISVLKGGDREQILKSVGRHFRFGISREGAKDFPLVIVQCKQRFPINATMRLVWGKGIESLSGVKTSADQVLSYKVREPFKATFSCDRENEKADCIPILPFQIYFSNVFPREYAEKIVMRGPKNTIFKPVLSRSEGEGEGAAKKPDFVDRLVFAAPLPPLASFTIELPKDIKDDAGRSLSNANKFPLTLKTADYPPLAKFAADFGIIERADPFLPVTLRNIEAEVKTHLFDARDNKNMAEKTADGVAGVDQKSYFRPSDGQGQDLCC